MKPTGPVARKDDYEVRACTLKEASTLVQKHHYAKGAANTAVASHCLVKRSTGELVGAALWMPPTKVAAQSVDKEDWRNVLNLSRLVVVPGEPQNAAGFLLGRSIRLLPRRWNKLVTWADMGRGHEGTVYKATNWKLVATTDAKTPWMDPITGRQVAIKRAKHTRTVAEMLAAGYVRGEKRRKLRFVFFR